MPTRKEKQPEWVTSGQLDRVKYLDCIRDAAGGLIYAWPDYLDGMASHWSVLVYGDYEAVMPLPWNRKWGVRYLYNPAFTPQLGVFSAGPADATLRQLFYIAARKKFPFCELFLNPADRDGGMPEKQNLTLALNRNYADIAAGYKKNLSDNLKKTTDLRYVPGTGGEAVIRLYQEEYGNRFPHVTNRDYARFTALVAKLASAGAALVREVRDGATQELLAAGIFLTDGRRITNIMPVTLAAGRPRFAGHLLLDGMIREMAGRAVLFDFEGSAIAGVAEFYQRFGAACEPYPFLRFNRLPFPFRYLKTEKSLPFLPE